MRRFQITKKNILKLIKKLLICFIITFMIGCVHRNNFGQVRPNKIRFSIKNCKDEKVYSKIDTSVIYFSEFERQNSRSKYINAYKFYSNNRIAFFTDISLDKLEELNPEKAHMGYYSTCFENNKIQIAFYHAAQSVLLRDSLSHDYENLLKNNQFEFFY